MIKRHPLAAFCVLALALTWGVVPIGSFAALGAAVAALAITAVTDGRAGLRAWGSRIVRWRVGRRWYVVAGAIPLSVVSLAAALNVAFGAPLAAAHNVGTWYALVSLFLLRLLVPLMA